jgi:hypothetical protein
MLMIASRFVGSASAYPAGDWVFTSHDIFLPGGALVQQMSRSWFTVMSMLLIIQHPNGKRPDPHQGQEPAYLNGGGNFLPFYVNETLSWLPCRSSCITP